KSREDYEILADMVAEGARTATGDATTSAEAREYVGDDGLVGFWIVDAVYETTNSRDMTDFLFDLMDAPQTVCRAMEAFDELKKKQIEAFNESEADVLVYDVCSASTSLLNPQMVADYVIPRARWVAENVSKDKIWGFFTTGKIRAVLPALVDVAPDYIQHFDILGDSDLAEVKREFGSRVAIMGNYSPVVLARGSLADARQEAKRCLDAAMAGGGYAITTSDEVPADAKMDNMKAVVEYVNTHGRY
ncbi:MAG: uroporphyrinogen decarboxylase family protein, partial [Phycisphaerae bacterium]|nr:uroporphyrinogen decarboxylase family protein [Phycisphaerae bacterium]